MSFTTNLFEASHSDVLIISMSPDDPSSWEVANNFRKQPGDKVVRFDEPYPEFFSGRVLFSGHGSTLTFGQANLTPEAFVRYLIDKKFPFEKIHTLDLFGCEIGLLKNGGGKSYAQRVAEELYKAGITHITVRSINSLVTDKEVHAILMTNYLDGSVTVFGVPMDRKEAYEQKYLPECRRMEDEFNLYQKYLKELISLIPKSCISSREKNAIFIPLDLFDTVSDFKSSLDKFKEKLAREEKQQVIVDYFNAKLELLYDRIPDEKAVISNEINEGVKFVNEMTELHSSLLTDIRDRRDKLVEVQRINDNYCIRIAEFKDFKGALDSYDKFKLTPDRIKSYSDFDYDRWRLWGKIQDRIKDKNEKYAQPRSCSFFRRTHSKRKPQLEILKAATENATVPISDLIDMATRLKLFKSKEAKYLSDMQQRIAQEEKAKAKRGLG